MVNNRARLPKRCNKNKTHQNNETHQNNKTKRWRHVQKNTKKTTMEQLKKLMDSETKTNNMNI